MARGGRKKKTENDANLNEIEKYTRPCTFCIPVSAEWLIRERERTSGNA